MKYGENLFTRRDPRRAREPAPPAGAMVSRNIQIAESGSFNGKVDVDVAEVRGHFQGEMTARKKLVVHASGRVSGKIRYGRMLVQEGGEVGGDIGALTDAPAVAVVR